MKICSRCGETKPLTAFGRAGTRGQCTPCRIAVNKEWERKNPEKVRLYKARCRVNRAEKERAYRRSYYSEHKERLRARAYAWREANKSTFDETKRRCRAKSKQKIREYNRQYREQHLEKVRAARQKWATTNRDKARAIAGKRIARLVNAPGSGITGDQWSAVLRSSGGLCVYCNGRPTRLELDHVDPLSRGGAHDVENAVPSCLACNRSKHDKPLLLWLACMRKGAP